MSASRVDHRTGLTAAGFIGFQLLVVVSALFAIQGATPAIAILFVSAGTLLVAAALVSPVALLLLAPLIILVPYRFLTFYGFEWLLMAALAASALLHVSGRRPWPAPSAMEVLWVAYAAWAGLAVTRAGDTYSALQGMSRILIAGMAFVAGYRILGGSRARILLRVMALLALALGVQLAGKIILRGYSLDLVTSRLSAVSGLGWGFSNYVAAVASLAAACAIILLLYGTRFERVIGTFGIAGAVVVQVTTLSRGGAMALLIGLLLAGLVEARRRLLPVILIVSGVVAAYLFSPLGEANLARFSTPQGMASIGARLIFFREAWAIWRTHWLAGVGPDQIPFHTPLYIGPNPHNIVLKQLADLGLVGLVIYAALIGTLISKALRARLRARSRDGRVLAVTMIIVLGVALANAQYEPTLGGDVYGFLFWLLMGTLARRAEQALRVDSPSTA